MLYLDGKRLSYDTAFTHDGVKYPSNWLRLASYEEKLAIGIVEIADPPRYDQRFYWDNGSPKDHEQLIVNWVGTTKYTAGTLLAPTDWYIVRNTEVGTEVPQEVLERRSEIRSYSNEKEAAIELGIISPKKFDIIVQPKKMI